MRNKLFKQYPYQSRDIHNDIYNGEGSLISPCGICTELNNAKLNHVICLKQYPYQSRAIHNDI